MTTTGSGVEVTDQSVPSIGGNAQIVSSAHLTDGNRAEGVAYNENPGVDLDAGPYPSGTVMSDSTPGDNVN